MIGPLCHVATTIVQLERLIDYYLRNPVHEVAWRTFNGRTAALSIGTMRRAPVKPRFARRVLPEGGVRFTLFNVFNRCGIVGGVDSMVMPYLNGRAAGGLQSISTPHDEYTAWAVSDLARPMEDVQRSF